MFLHLGLLLHLGSFITSFYSICDAQPRRKGQQAMQQIVFI